MRARWFSDSSRYGVAHIALHWGSGLIVCGLFASGLWMVELDYYSAWYHRAPDLHRSFAVVLVALTLVRLGLGMSSTMPERLTTWDKTEAMNIPVGLGRSNPSLKH